MSKAYNEIMDKIEITSDMQTRILNNINAVDFSKKRKALIASKIKVISTVAACIVFIVACAAVIQNNRDINEPQIDTFTPNFGSVMLDSIDELSQKAGFDVMEITQAGDAIISYYFRSDNVAETMYVYETNTITLSQGAGSDDISGDFNEYDKTSEVTIGNLAVTMKGNNNTVSLAIWCNEGCAFSLYSDSPLTEDEFIRLIESIK